MTSKFAKNEDFRYIIAMVNHMRHTRAHTGNRRSHHGLDVAPITLCDNCGHAKAKHVVCSNCGRYKGRVVIDMQKQIDKAQAKKDRKSKNENKA